MVSSPKVLKREVYEATREAQDFVALAQQKAKQIIDDAERGREAIFEQARQEGYAKGLSEWNEVLLRAKRRAEEMAKAQQETVLRLSVRIAEKIIGQELKQHTETIVEIVREALKDSRPGRHLTIQVNEAEAETVRGRISRLKQMVPAAEIEIVGSPSISPGGCSIESELGIIDARLETQLKCLEDILVQGVAAD